MEITNLSFHFMYFSFHISLSKNPSIINFLNKNVFIYTINIL